MVKLAVDDNLGRNPVFARLPEAPGYPHLWVVAADGTLIESLDTTPLERGRNDYDPKAFRAFVARHAPRPH